MKVGIAVRCAVCGKRKKPRGRSAPMGMVLCEPPFLGPEFGEPSCHGYREPPLVGDLWPGETEEEFGYPVSANGTEER